MSAQPYLVSIAAGLAVGVVYGAISVRSPAPPIIALLGLLGMLAGEAGVQWLKSRTSFVQTCLHEKSFSLHKSADSSPVASDRSRSGPV